MNTWTSKYDGFTIDNFLSVRRRLMPKLYSPDENWKPTPVYEVFSRDISGNEHLLRVFHNETDLIDFAGTLDAMVSRLVKDSGA